MVLSSSARPGPRSRTLLRAIAAFAAAAGVTILCQSIFSSFKQRRPSGSPAGAAPEHTTGDPRENPRLLVEARSRLKPYFHAAGAPWPSDSIALLVFKKEKRLELWAHRRSWRFVRHYPVLAASGYAGPKLREGDYQVPEGLYRIVMLNPKSSYHLSMKINYPNEFDLLHAREDGRAKPGFDIFIHGRAVSIGCVAIGDPAIEELFALVTDVGMRKVSVIIAPEDFRSNSGPIARPADAPLWVNDLYAKLYRELRRFPRPS